VLFHILQNSKIYFKSYRVVPLLTILPLTRDLFAIARRLAVYCMDEVSETFTILEIL